jgi:hypothetical protein
MTNYTFQQLINFTRTTSGTFVGSNGLIQNTPASRNLLTWTQEFDNAAWTKLNASVTANTTAAPDGTMTADTLSDGTATDNHGVRPTSLALTNSTTYTLSVYAKASTRRYIILNLVATSSATTYSAVSFDLQTGVAVNSAANGTGYNVVSSSIQNVGNGWYRCIATLTIGSVGTALQTYIGTSLTGVIGNFGLNSYTGTDGTVFIWGAQLETGSTATDYTRNVGGLFPARFDYDPVTLAPRGILIEEQRTNLLTYSEDFANAAWTKTRATVTANSTTAPDGTSNADKLVEDTTAGNTHLMSQSPTIVTATNYSFSVYLKAAERTFARVLVGDTGGNNGVRVDVNLSTGAVSTGLNGTGWTLISATATSVGNGWYRVSISGTSASSTSGAAIIYLASALGTIVYTGDGTSGIFIWGAQLEAGAFATSYIPTVASQVTRTADQASIVAPNFAPWYNQSEGTFVVEWDGFKPTTASGAPTIFQAGNGTTSFIDAILSGANYLARVSVGGVNQAEFTPAYVANATEKFATAYKVNDFAFSRNGATALVDTSGSVPTDLDRMGVGISRTSTNPLNGHIRSIKYYPVRLSDLQLQALTQ